MKSFSLCHPCVGILAALLPIGCDDPGASPPRGDNQAAAAAAPVADVWETYTVTGRAHVERVNLPGASVRGYETTRLMAKLGGFVREIKSVRDEEIDIGTIVSKGTILAELDIPELGDELQEKVELVADARSAVLQAQAGIAQAQAELKKQKAGVKQAEYRPC